MQMPPDSMLGVSDTWDENFHKHCHTLDYDVFKLGVRLSNVIYSYCEVQTDSNVSPIGREITQNLLRYDKMPDAMYDLVDSEEKVIAYPGLYTEAVLVWSYRVRQAIKHYCPELENRVIPQTPWFDGDMENALGREEGSESNGQV